MTVHVAAKMRQLTNFCLVGAFACSLVVPLVGCLLDWDPVTLNEQRTLASFPDWSTTGLTRLPSALEAWCNDHFGFRQCFIRVHNSLDWHFLKANRRVLQGRDNWLFLYTDVMEDYVGFTSFEARELAALRAGLEEKYDYCRQHGIAYLAVIAPNKSTVYPEYLPAYVAGQRGETRLDQFRRALEGSAVPLLDLTDALQEAKCNGVLYYSNDTHWNPLGSLYAYQGTCRRIPNGWAVAPDDLDAFRVEPARREGDLARMLGLAGLLQIDSLTLVPQDNAVQKTQEDERCTRYVNSCASHKLLLIHDSFGYAGGYRELLARHFGHTACYLRCSQKEDWQRAVEAERPDVVIEEIVERTLARLGGEGSDGQQAAGDK